MQGARLVCREIGMKIGNEQAQMVQSGRYPGAGKFGRARSTCIVVLTALVKGKACGRDWRKAGASTILGQALFPGLEKSRPGQTKTKRCQPPGRDVASQAQMK